MKKFIKENGKNIIIIIVIATLLLLSLRMIEIIKEKTLENNLKDIEWIAENTKVEISKSLGKNIYWVNKDENILPYNNNYQKVIDEELEKLLKKEYTFEEPLLILNPYGTNNLGLNIYFNTEESSKISYTISVENEKIPDFSRTLNNDEERDYAKKHQYQLIGLVPEEVNTIELVAKTKDGNKIKNTITIDMSEVYCESDTILESVEGESDEELTEGLYVLFGLDKAFNANNYLYDNNGILRADLVLTEYRSDRIIFNDDKLIYSYDMNKIAIIDRMGRIEKKYTLDGYIMHHDYVLDKENNKLLILVNSKAEEDKTIEDLVISLNLKSGEITEIIDMKELLPEIYETAKMPESGKNTYGGTGLDWIHLNSLSLIEDKEDIVLSAREISTIIYVEDIYEKASIKYLIADESVYKNTKYEDLMLKQIGDFVNHAGQHTITYVKDTKLKSGQYYLEMYNNNYGNSNTRKDFPWEEYSGVGSFEEGDSSKYYKYLVDENKNSYQLIESFDVAYSSIVSSVQDIEKNHITSSGKSNCYAEYDEDGKLIKQFNYTSKKYAYRAFKYTFEDVWFA